jgi:hypothetical protein
MAVSKTTRDSRETATGDLVLREVWRAKDALSASYGHDLDKFCADVREREKHSGHRVVNLQGKRKKPANGISGTAHFSRKKT